VKVIKYTHACVRIESDGVLVIDPGTFTERAALDGVDAILITHEHVDHVDVDKIGDELAKHPSVRIYTNPAVAEMLTGLESVVTTVNAGDEFEAAGLPVKAYGGLHAEIHPDVPRVANLGFLVADLVYHPGDSFDVPEGATVDTLFVPISGPWLKASESVDFIRAIQPRRAYALHDSLLSDTGLGLMDRLLPALGKAEYARLASGEPVSLP
jgi:L-ascorbate metabolism protein UlaG (beta-lactamase superfamily)